MATWSWKCNSTCLRMILVYGRVGKVLCKTYYLSLIATKMPEPGYHLNDKWKVLLKYARCVSPKWLISTFMGRHLLLNWTGDVPGTWGFYV